MDVHGDEKNLSSLHQRLRNGSKRFRPCCVWPLTGARGVELNPFRRLFLGKGQGQSRTGCVMKMSDDNSFISTGSELGPHTLLGQPFESLSPVTHTFPHGYFFASSEDSETSLSCTASFSSLGSSQNSSNGGKFHPNEEINICFIC